MSIILTIFLALLLSTLFFPQTTTSQVANYDNLNLFQPEMSTFDFTETEEMPVLFLSHAAPVLIMKESESIMGRKNDAHFKSPVADWYRSIPTKMGLINENKPKAIVQFSAHYETGRGPLKILAQDKYKGLLYDYYGFPNHTYDVKYPAPGSVQLAKHIQNLFTQAGVKSELDPERGIDHGGFIPLMLMYPEADIPVIQISICDNAKQQRHYGEILSSLRKQGVLIIGSGQTTHGSFNPTKVDIEQQHIFAREFTKQLMPEDWSNKSNDEVYKDTTESLSNDEIYTARAKVVDNWTSISGAKFAHPHYDHYMPFPGCVGATKNAEDQKMHIIGDHWLVGMHSLRTFVFGAYPLNKMVKAIR
jgi:aromatic ring-opening dioxygenase catalytic subunit (LigB family)